MKVAISEPESRTSVLKGDSRNGKEGFVHENGRRKIAAPTWFRMAQIHVGVSLLAIAECQAVKCFLIHRYREQARSHRELG
jgi:hypothetical protein